MDSINSCRVDNTKPKQVPRGYYVVHLDIKHVPILRDIWWNVKPIPVEDLDLYV